MDSIHDFIMQYDGYIWGKSSRLARDAAEADELHQKASIILWRYYSRLAYQSDVSVKAFLNKSIKNALIDLRRREKRIQSYDELPMQMSSPDNSHENAVLDKMVVMSVIHHLSAQDQDIIFKTYFMEMNSAEIGKQMNMSPSTVRSRQKRAIGKLRKSLQEKG